MCGLVGSFKEDKKLVTAMLERIKHRGPDGSGISTHGQAVHGHVRLALVDLSNASAQPFKHNKNTVSFNGEIWNYRELKKNSDTNFLTTGDTEVLADQLDRFGLSCLHNLDGMFAFVWSGKNGEHYIVRDSFGKIPIYIAKTENGYLWASERKAFPKKIKSIPIPTGTAFDLNTGKWVKWYNQPNHKKTTSEDVFQLLDAGVKKRITADAPVCCLISGGLDSGIILALAKKHDKNVTAFTGVFDKNSEDLKSARNLCAELDVDLIEVSVDLSSELISQAISAIEISSKAQIEIAMLCIPLAERIYKEGFRAVLSGEAADELFGGYSNFCIQASKSNSAGVVALRKQQLEKMSRGNFVRCNKAFMAAGVECRLPFMEQELVERVVLLNKEESPLNKKLLKQAAKDILPSWVIKRQKDTFQGGSGISQEMSSRVANPIVYYNTELKKQYGYIPKA